MRSIQYCHERLHNSDGSLKSKGGRTVVTEKITLAEFDAITPSLQHPAFTLKVGMAVCGKKENYNKKLGREIARGRMKEYPLYASAKSGRELQLVNSDLGITLIFMRNEVTGDINFVDIV